MGDDINITITETTENINVGVDSNNYILPIATTSILGGVIVDGATISADSNGVISLTNDIPAALSELADDNTHRLVTDIEKTTWNNKVNSGTDFLAAARAAISENVVGLSYDDLTGILSLTSGYIIPTITNFNKKVDSEENKGLSSNDFSDALKSKLDGIQASAQVNTVNSVNGKTGLVSLSTADVTENTNLYYKDTRVDTRISAQKGVANGVATLGADSKIPLAQIPDSIASGSTLMGTWDASTGTYPTSSPSNGQYWIINVAGTIELIAYNVGDYLLYSSETGWEKISVSSGGGAVDSVNGKTGVVLLTTTDIPGGTNEYYTDEKVSDNADVQKGVTANEWGNHATAGYAKDNEVVHTQGDETVYGNKTFDDTLYVNDRLNVGSNTFDVVNPEFVKIDGGESASVNIMSAYSNYDNYVQVNIKNNNDGEYASSDFVATADTGQEGANYIDMGINNSNFESEEFDIVGALDGYLVVDSGDLAVGTASPNKKLVLFTGGTLQENKRGTLTDSDLTLSVDISATNLSGTNSGDETNATIKAKLGSDLTEKATKTELTELELKAIGYAIAFGG